MYVKFKNSPPLEHIRSALSRAGLRAEEVTQFDEAWKNEIQIRIGGQTQDQNLGTESSRIHEILRRELDAGFEGKNDLNNLSTKALSARLQELDPDNMRGKSLTEAINHYDAQAKRVTDLRTRQGGILQDFSPLERLGLSSNVVKALKEDFYPGSFTILSVESVGPKVGQELRDRAFNAILFSLAGMLIYIALRFRPIFGVAAVIALFHDVLVTVGIFSLMGKEISLTVVAALLTLVGYSINDTIVIFDRVRENQRIMKRSSSLASIINTSINQTLNRTILTSGMTFLAVFSLYMFGGEVLSGFSFALVIGLITGTYSTLGIASPIVVWWQNFSDRRKAHT